MSIQTPEDRAKMVLYQATQDLDRLETQYRRARQSLAEQLQNDDGPKWDSSSLETEWRTLRAQRDAKREEIKTLRWILGAS